jgi:hypothetical protein
MLSVSYAFFVNLKFLHRISEAHPCFFILADEVEAFLKFLMRHQNTPAFVSKKLIQYFGLSNPSPGYALRVTEAFKKGTFSNRGVTFGDGT